MASFNPLITGNVRVYLVDGGTGAENDPEFLVGAVMGSVSRALGESESILIPSTLQYEKFEEVGTISGTPERASSSLNARFPRDKLSRLVELANEQADLVLHAHIGSTTDPRTFNRFEKAIVFPSTKFSNIDIEDLGSQDTNAAIGISVPFTSEWFYEVVNPLSYAERAQALVGGQVNTVFASGTRFGVLGTPLRLFAATAAAGGSPATTPDLLYTLNGSTWYSHDVDTITDSSDIEDGAVLGDYVVLVSNGTGSLHVANLDDMDGVSDPAFTEASTGIVGAPNAISVYGNTAYIAGASGYIYSTSDPTAGVDVLDAGSATTDDLNAIHAASNELICAVGNNGAVIFSTDGSSFTSKTRPVGAGVHLNAVWVFDAYRIFVGTSGGALYYTTDGGTTWTAKGLPKSGGAVKDIFFPTKEVGYIAYAGSDTKGYLIRTVDGGYSWFLESGSPVPVSDALLAVSGIENKPNLVIAGGLADDGSDGIVVVGQGSLA